MLVHSHYALKGRPRVVRTVKPLFRLPRSSGPRSIRERVEFLKLACLQLGLGSRIIGQRKKRIIRGGWLGSSVLNPVHLPMLYRWEGQGELVQLQLPLATLEFFAQAKTGADHTINKLPLSQEWRGQSDLFNIYAVHAI